MNTTLIPDTLKIKTTYYRVVIDDGTDEVISNTAKISVKSATDLLIIDRTQDDISYWQTLRQKIIDQTATDSERAEWLGMVLRGCYTQKDFNRLGVILNYLTTQGLQISYPYQPKTDWKVNDDISTTEINKLLANLRVVRNLTGTPPLTPQVPTGIKDYNDANTIELILKVGIETIINTQLGFQYAGDQTYTNGTY